jgi:small subunit ribosomal protein S21
LTQNREAPYVQGLTRFVFRHPTPTIPEARVSEIIIAENENVDRAIRRFKKQVDKAGILTDARKHREYEKPSERRKRKAKAATRGRRVSRNG